ncbi:Hypothetical predicted protein [Mytilus galloprovincialis]|uniref:Mitochondrial cytochrome c oxidase subunit VIc/VIIs domain-containing protein n=1 Tax=Mytilus galloprovincialis TaxID=29158 RepID=A0A8B6HI72_MYTGA|nr:Hypothetical predicted protein [Mytilus galloprovincialis]
MSGDIRHVRPSNNIEMSGDIRRVRPIATAVGVRQNIKELTTRKRLKKYYILPLSIAGLAALAVTQYEYNKCKEKFFKDWYDYHKARNFTRFPEGSDTAV